MNEAVILLDTNVVSELMRPKPAQAVLDWFAAQDSTKLFFSAVSEAELRTGAAILSAGRRRDSLTATIDIMITEDFAGRVLPFDSAAAKAYAAIAASRRAAGQPIRKPIARSPPSPVSVEPRSRPGMSGISRDATSRLSILSMFREVEPLHLAKICTTWRFGPAALARRGIRS
jgi:predicted nucleic acid-binding protein